MFRPLPLGFHFFANVRALSPCLHFAGNIPSAPKHRRMIVIALCVTSGDNSRAQINPSRMGSFGDQPALGLFGLRKTMLAQHWSSLTRRPSAGWSQASIREGVISARELSQTYTERNHDHPSMLCALGMLPAKV